jgi:hypothetical protein
VTVRVLPFRHPPHDNPTLGLGRIINFRNFPSRRVFMGKGGFLVLLLVLGAKVA